MLPVDIISRSALLDHFNLKLENKAKAFIKYVESISLPSNDKKNALSAPWSLSTAKRILNIQQETSFAIYLAKADRIKPRFADFVYQTGQRINIQ